MKMKKRLGTVVLAMIVMAVPLFAQDFPANAPSRESVMKLMEVMHASEQIDASTNMIASQIKQQMRDSWLREHPNTPEKSLRKIDAAIDEAMHAVSRDEMMSMLTDIYRRHLTKGDVDAAVAFYSSPAGQHFLAKMPVIMQEVMQASSAKYEAKRIEIEERLGDVLKQLNDENPNETEPKK